MVSYANATQLQDIISSQHVMGLCSWLPDVFLTVDILIIRFCSESDQNQNRYW